MLWSDDRVEQVSERGLNLVNPEFYYVNRLIVSDIRDDYEAALATQAAEIERLRTENADQVTQVEDLKSEMRALEREVGRLENRPAPSFTTKEMSAQLAVGGYLIIEPRDMDLFKYNNSACPVCGQAHP